MQRLPLIILFGINFLLISSCASVNSKVYSKSEITMISGWLIELAYESGSVETTNKTSGDRELKVIKSGQLLSDLELREDLFYMLVDDYSIPITKKTTNSTGKILIHPIHSGRRSSFKSLTVTLTNNNGDTLARIKIKNGTNNSTFKDGEDFAKYAADAIAAALEEAVEQQNEEIFAYTTDEDERKNLWKTVNSSNKLEDLRDPRR